MNEEIWKPIEEFLTYEVSNFGNVRSMPKKHIRKNAYRPYKTVEINLKKIIMLKFYVRKKNNNPTCVTVNLRKNNKTKVCRVHRLVLTAFIRKPEKNEEGCHNDGNPLNNNLTNLRWDTHHNNCLDMVKHGTKSLPPIKYGEKHHKTTLNENDIIQIRNQSYYHGLFVDLSKKYNVNAMTISRIYKNLSWKYFKEN